jgi:hypothetical protein
VRWVHKKVYEKELLDNYNKRATEETQKKIPSSTSVNHLGDSFSVDEESIDT